MATFINDTRISHISTNPSYLEYVTLTGSVTKSGNTVTISDLAATVRVSGAYSVWGETQNYYISESASSTSAKTSTGTFTFNFSNGPNHTESHSMSSFSFTPGSSETSKTFYLRASYNEDAQLPFTVTFPSGTVTTVVTVSSKTYNSVSGNTTKNSGGSTVTYIGPGTDYTSIVNNQIGYVSGASGSGTYPWSFSSGLSSNTQYGIVAFVWGGGEGLISSVQDGTLPAKALSAQTVSSTTTNSATISYTTQSDGGYYPKYIQYSLDNGSTWQDGAVVSSGSATSGSFEITDLTAGTSYVVLLRVHTTAGNTSSGNVSFSTQVQLAKNKLYGSVNNLSESIHDFYGGVNNQTQRVTKIYGRGSETGFLITAVSPAVVDLKTFVDMYYRTYGPFTFRPESIGMYSMSGTTRVYVADWGASNQVELFRYPTGAYDNEGRIWGFLSEPVPVSSGSSRVATLTSSSTQSALCRLVHQGFGHYDYGYGVVTYYTDANRVDTDVVYLSSQSEVVQLSRGYGNNPTQSWNAVIGGVTIPNDRIKEVVLTEKVTTLNGSAVYQCFLANCAYVTKVDLSRARLTAIADEGYFCWRNYRLKQLYLPDTVTSIGNGFCISAGTYTSPAFSPSLVLPSRLVTIGNYFLSGADTFNQDLSLPQTLTSIGTSFLGNMRYMTGVVNVGSLSADIIAAGETSFYSSYGVPAYSTGISIAGSTRAAWLAKFPNSSSSPYYRKLVDAGY